MASSNKVEDWDEIDYKTENKNLKEVEVTSSVYDSKKINWSYLITKTKFGRSKVMAINL